MNGENNTTDGKSFQKQKYSTKRKRQIRVHVRLSGPEYRAAKLAADGCGISIPALMRSLATGHKPRSVVDARHAKTLMSARAELRKMGGLFKLYQVRAKAGEFGEKEQEIRPEALMRRIEAATGLLLRAANAMLVGGKS